MFFHDGDDDSSLDDSLLDDFGLFFARNTGGGLRATGPGAGTRRQGGGGGSSGSTASNVVTAQTAEEVTDFFSSHKSKHAFIVDLYAHWCPYCSGSEYKQQWHSFAHKFQGAQVGFLQLIYQVRQGNTTEAGSWWNDHFDKPRSFPTFMVFRNHVGRSGGALSLEKVGTVQGVNYGQLEGTLRQCLTAPGSASRQTAETPEKRLIQAAKDDDVSTLEEIGDSSPNIISQLVNCTDSAGDSTPLMWAAERGSTRAVRWLINKGADVSKKTGHLRYTALSYAMERGNVQCARMILDRHEGERIPPYPLALKSVSADEASLRPYCDMCRRTNFVVRQRRWTWKHGRTPGQFDLCLDCFADPVYPVHGDDVVLVNLRSAAVLNGKTGKVEKFDSASWRYVIKLDDGGMQKSLKPDNVKKMCDDHPEGHTTLHYLIRDNQWDAVRKFLESAIGQREARKATKAGQVPLHWAAGERAPADVVRLLIRTYPQGVRVKSTDDAQALPLHFAVAKRAPADVVELLLKEYPQGVHEKSFNASSPQFPIEMAERFGASEDVKRLLRENERLQQEQKRAEGRHVQQRKAEAHLDNAMVTSSVDNFFDLQVAILQAEEAGVQSELMSRARALLRGYEDARKKQEADRQLRRRQEEEERRRQEEAEQQKQRQREEALWQDNNVPSTAAATTQLSDSMISGDASDDVVATDKTNDISSEPTDIAFSLRFGEAKDDAKILKQRLEERGFRVYLASVKSGDDIADDIVQNFVAAKLIVVFGSYSYGDPGTSWFGTDKELRWLLKKRKPYFLIKMCTDFKHEWVDLAIPSSVSYEMWEPGTPLKDDLVDKIVEKLRGIESTLPLFQSSAQSTSSGDFEQAYAPFTLATATTTPSNAYNDSEIDDGNVYQQTPVISAKVTTLDEPSDINANADLLVEAAEYVYKEFYSKPYTEWKGAPEKEPPNYYMDFFWDGGDGHRVERPNHGLANAVRKAFLGKHLVSEYRTHYVGTSWSKQDFDNVMENHLVVMQIALLFETCCRESEIGFGDDQETYAKYRKASCEAFDNFAKSKSMSSRQARVCLVALEHMYMQLNAPETYHIDPADATILQITKHIFEMSHDLDLCRCTFKSKMDEHLKSLKRDVGTQRMEAIAACVEQAILVTGDRLMYSPTQEIERGYHPKDFFNYSTDVVKCLNVVEKAFCQKEIVKTAAATKKAHYEKVHGELGTRLSTSQFRNLHNALLARWTVTEWTQLQQFEQVEELGKALKSLVKAYGEKESLPKKAIDEFLAKLLRCVHQAAGNDENMEIIATKLWTLSDKLDGPKVEFCSILNHAIRTDDPQSLQIVPATKITCMMQHFLNAERREKCNANCWPQGDKAEKGKGWSTTENTVYRGGGLPDEHGEFFKCMNDLKPRAYRVPMLLATSFDKGVAKGFMDRQPESMPKVLWTIKLDAEDKCKHVNYLEKITNIQGESEFLFSAYSAFTVEEITWSEDPYNGDPHLVTLKAVSDNKKVADDVPCAPWH
ncbi:SAP domain-containing protein [Pseudoscourfieldia marina]